MTGGELLRILIAGLIGTLVGGLVQVAHTRYKEFLERKRVAGALLGEISALVAMVRRRRYIEGIAEVIRETETVLAKGGALGLQHIRVYTFQATQDYFQVFNAMADRVGLLGAERARDVATLYTNAKGILEDMRRLRENPDFGTIQDALRFNRELHQLFVDTVDLADRVVGQLSAMTLERFLGMFG